MIDQIRQAAAVAAAANSQLRHLVVQAMRGPNRNVIKIAQAAGVTPQTVYRWNAYDSDGDGDGDGDGDARPYESPGPAMYEALLALLNVGAGPAHELAAGLRTDDLKARARRVLLCAKNVPPGDLPDESRAIISVGCMAAQHVLNPKTGSR